MFKKSLTALAVLGVAAGYASATEVTLYGVADLGLMYNHSKVDDGTTTEKTDSFGLDSGINAGSRFGLKGTEDLGNGLTVGFKLENSFNADDGTLGHGSRLFGREASVSLSGDFGTLSAGRMGGVGSSAGVDTVYSTGDAFDGGDNNILGLAISTRYDNLLQYQTPVFAGLQGTFQYSFKGDNKNADQEKAREGSSAVDRYMSASLNGNWGAVNAVVGYEFFNYASFEATAHEDGQIVYLGGNYDCGFAKTFAMAQYFKGIKANGLNALAFLDEKQMKTVDGQYDDGFKGYGLHLGTQVPVLAGLTTVGLYYVDATAESTNLEDRDGSYYGVAARYEYPLSKRTAVYTGAGYGKTTMDSNAAFQEQSYEIVQAYVGLKHTF